MRTIRKRIFDIIQIGQKSDLLSHGFDIMITIVIVLNILVMFLQTFDTFSGCTGFLKGIEIVSIIIFLIEYILRIWTADYLYPSDKRIVAIGKFLISFDGIISLFTILPFFFLSGFVAFRMLRVVRIFHLFRINSSYDSFNVITGVLYEKRNQIISSVFIIMILIMASSLCMYSAENSVQPEVFKNAFSGIWWSISTILTVGYGDIYPITVIGRIMAIIIALLGVGVVAIPTGIISAGFVEEYTKIQNTKDMSVPATVNALVEKDGPFAGRKLKDVEKEFDIQIVVVIRNGDVIMPGENHKIHIGDKIIYQTKNLFNS